ncbi:zinc finger MYM-type protein 4 [Lampris incognitus]|uniref:zinc finger MYM-type protein 4 n=1 Tax=Lampris incognitus TaxID=2546036 RepID=UPI0024B559F6|nr:zinc finger MYM-type protein 4 [Lampris incognitus]
MDESEEPTHAKVNEETSQELDGTTQEVGALKETDSGTYFRDSRAKTKFGEGGNSGIVAVSSPCPSSSMTAPAADESWAEVVDAHRPRSSPSLGLSEDNVSMIETVRVVLSPCAGEAGSTTECEQEGDVEVEIEGTDDALINEKGADGVLREVEGYRTEVTSGRSAVFEDSNTETATGSISGTTDTCDPDEEMDADARVRNKEADDSKKGPTATPMMQAINYEPEEGAHNLIIFKGNATTTNTGTQSCSLVDSTVGDLRGEHGKPAQWNVASNTVDLNSKLGQTNANDLDEMMDIGTLDQMEQEAQMEGEQQKQTTDIDMSSSSLLSDTTTVSGTRDGKSLVPPDSDEKPHNLPKPMEEDPIEDTKVPVDLLLHSSTTPSEATASTGTDLMNETKVVRLSLPKSDSECSGLSAPTSQRSSSTSGTGKRCLSPLPVKVKDEPLDEEYEHALTSSTSTADIKDEPGTAEEDLKIGVVFSVGGKPVTASSEPIPAPPKTALTTTTSKADSSNQNPGHFPLIPPGLRVACSHCKKNLLKGQTAFQKKGFPDLFCSTSCLTTSSCQPKPVTKYCHYCLKSILRPQELILAPVDSKGTMKDFCSQACLSSFNYKRNISTKIPIQPSTTNPSQAPKSHCSMCKRFCISKHEVILNSAIHKMCSDPCFIRFRAINNLMLASCEICHSYCLNKPLTLKVEDGTKTVCTADCLAKLKKKINSPQPCALCRASRTVSDMIENKDGEDKVELFCSSSCVLAHKVQTARASGAPMACDSCGKTTVPAYHLAMSDTSIRNFCSLPCVVAFQEKFSKTQKKVSITPKIPIAAAPIPSITSRSTQSDAPKPKGKLQCFQCSQFMTAKPEVIPIKNKVVFVCDSACSEEYRKANLVMAVCEYCKLEKVTKQFKRINQKDYYFCSDGCGLLHKHDLDKKWKKYCHSCAYCLSISERRVTGYYGDTLEEFCSEDCRSKYTILLCQVAKCDSCGHQGKLVETLSLPGEVKRFCDMQCLLNFCSNKALTQGQVFAKAVTSPSPAGIAEATPIIADVVSLASTLTEQPNDSNNTALQGTVPKVSKRSFLHAGTQTDASKAPATTPRLLKNKALLCRPMVQNKGVTCKTQTVDSEAQTDDKFPTVVVLPIPVPVFLPLPMNMYSQFTPKPMGLPLPLPVPMFLPVTLDSAERIVETIQEIKEKIPSDPLEADLILMAELVAEQDGLSKGKQKDRGLEKDVDRPEATDGHNSYFNEDFDTEDLDSFLSNWEDTSSGTSLKSSNRPYAHERLQPIVDVPLDISSEPCSEPTPPAPPPLDIEADFPVESLEKMARFREKAQQSPNAPSASPTPPPRRRQAHRKARDKNKGRRSQRLAKTDDAATGASQTGSDGNAMSREPPKLESKYGIDAWKRWIQWRETQPNMEKLRFGSRPVELKEDVLRCTTAELSCGLCRFIAEVRRPNREPYSPDSLFYLCLGIQQHLFENGRLENIFTDLFYSKFSMEITKILTDFKPSITPSGYIHSRVEEEYLWDCKQLGAYSPTVLLNTLLFFCSKYFGFTTLEQHCQLTFANVVRCTRTNADNTKSYFLRFYLPICLKELEAQSQNVADDIPAKKRKEDENQEVVLEMTENNDNPLRCPVRLYEFYLSKCSESVKQRTNLFYLQPERSCIPNSPVWFSSTPLDQTTMDAMLTRILTIREMHLGEKESKKVVDDPLYIPQVEEDESE